jgi:hypothetical protein
MALSGAVSMGLRKAKYSPAPHHRCPALPVTRRVGPGLSVLSNNVERGVIVDAPGGEAGTANNSPEERMTTGKKAASDAGKLLRKPSTPKVVKTVAASDEAQAKKKKGR